MIAQRGRAESAPSVATGRDTGSEWWVASRIIDGGRTVVPVVKGTRGGEKTLRSVQSMQKVAVKAKTDEELVALFQSGGDRDTAFMALFDRYGAMTHAFLRRRIGNADVASEINQDLYMGVLEGLDRFRGDSSFKTWLFRMAQNRLSNLRRRWRTHLDELPDSSPEELMEELLTSGDELPDEHAVRVECDRSLEQCLAGLPEIERAVVVGQYYEGATLEELTRRFKMTNKSGARASLIAAQRKLRRCLEQAGITGGTEKSADGHGRKR